MAVYPNMASMSLSVTQEAIRAVANRQESTADVTYYVDDSAGNDANDGSAAHPFKTLEKAVSMLPGIIENDTIAINLALGEYTLGSNGVSILSTINNGRVQINGTMTTVAPATGLSTGSFTTVHGVDYAGEYYCELATGGWTANDLIGKFVKSLDPSSTFYEWAPIIDNDATKIYMLDTYGKATPLAFTIQEPGTVITWGAGVEFRINTTNANGAFQIKTKMNQNPGPDYTPSIKDGMVHFRHITFQPNSTATSPIVISKTAQVSFYECKFVPTSTTSLDTITSSGLLFMDRCVVACPTGLTFSGDSITYLRRTSFMPQNYSTGALLDGQKALYFADGHSTIGLNCCYFQNYVEGGGAFVIWADGMSDVTMGFYEVASKIQDSNYGIYTNGRFNLSNAAWGYGGLKLSMDNVDYGILVDRSGRLDMMAVNNGAGTFLNITNVTYTAISVMSCYNNIVLGNGTVFTGSTELGDSPEWAINLAEPNWDDSKRYSRHNTVTFTGISSSSISDFDSGEMTLDGSTDTTLAALDGDADKTIMDAVRLNTFTIQ